MSDLLTKFMTKVLGEEGTGALQKAAERHPGLASALPARSILGWLLLAGRYGFEGEIPGIDSSYLSLKKGQGDLFDGFIETVGANGPEIYEFNNANILHVAAATSVALGTDISPDPTLKQIDVARLGKNLDILIMSRFIKLMKQEEESSEESSVDKGEFETGTKGKPLSAKAPEEPEPPSPKQRNIGPKRQPSLNITKAQAVRECDVCGEKQIKKHEAQLCFCLRDLAKHTKATQTNDGGYLLEFGEEWTANDLSVFIDMLGEK